MNTVVVIVIVVIAVIVITAVNARVIVTDLLIFTWSVDIN